MVGGKYSSTVQYLVFTYRSVLSGVWWNFQMHLRCSVTFLLCRVLRTILERNTKKEQTLNKIQKNYSHQQTRSESAQYSKSLNRGFPPSYSPLLHVRILLLHPFTYILRSKVVSMYVGTDTGITVRVIVCRIVAIYLTCCIRNRSIMAALDAECAGCARTTRPHWYAYALVNDTQAMQIVSTSSLVSLCFLSVLSLSCSFLFPPNSFPKSLQTDIVQ